MPTFSQTDRFRRDVANLTAEQKAAFRAAAARFVDDLSSGGFHLGTAMTMSLSAVLA